MTRKMKMKLLGGSLTVIAMLAAVPAARGLAATGSEPEPGPAACAAVADDLQRTATGLADQLVAVPPDLPGVSELVNELLGLGTGLVDLGCLPAPELPVTVPVSAEPAESGVALPLPTLPPVPPPPPVDPGLPTVPVCIDLTADLLDAITGVLASLLSTGVPDLTGALDALTSLVDTLTGITGEGCLPAAPVAS